MTEIEFLDMLQYEETTFFYKGKQYNICHPDDLFYVRESSWPMDVDLSFQDADDLLDHWIIQGRPFRNILPEIDLK